MVNSDLRFIREDLFVTNFIVLLINPIEIHCYVPYESPILGQVLDLISPPKTNISEPRFESYDPWDMAN